MDEMDEVIKEFLVESYESLDQLDSDLIALEDSPDDRDKLASIFRTVHTIKGTSGFLALPKLERVAHVGENLLVPLRDGALRLNGNIADGLLGMVDAIRVILSKLESEGSEGDADFAPLVERLESLLETGGTVAEAVAEIPVDEPSSQETIQKETVQQALPDDDVDQAAAEVQTVAPAEDTSHEPSAETVTPTPALDDTVTSPVVEPSAKATSSPVEESDPAPESNTKDHSVADSTVRIDVELLDKLMNLVGELVLARNQILQFCNETEDATMVAASQRLNLITTELQEGVMKTRMQPIRNAWSKLPRVVRDLSSSCGKKVDVRMEGADTELDKTILEAIKDPLTHIVRNSVDHGIESPDVRLANGKSPEGTLLLRAFHEGGQVNIEIADDGAGINADRVREKAIEKELITAEQADAMSERELTSLILLPGFSTAAKVTNVSGRGVGMDVVKTNIERIGGTLDIQSKPGHGTTLRIKIPLTLAIVPALIVNTGGDSYAIPQVGLLELVRLGTNRACEEIHFIHDTPVYRLRENLLPLIYLDEQLGQRERRGRHDDQESVNIVVLQAEDRPFGLVVDSITDTQEIVVKPLGPHMKNVPAYAGATIMGDGTVALILDVIGIARKSNVLTEHRDRSMAEKSAFDLHSTNESEALLIVASESGTRAAVRLSTVSRLEEFDAAKVEQTGHRSVIQYRGEILPLISLNGSDCMHYGSDPGMQQRLNTVVYSSGDRHVGVVVGKIVDIVHEPVLAENDTTRHRVVHDRVTEIVDLEQLVRQSLPELS